MATFVEVDDPTDARIADFAGLRQPDRRIAFEAEHGIFVGEGSLVARRMLEHPTLRLRSVLVTPSRRRDIDDLLWRHPGLTVYLAPPAVLRGIVGFDLHRGIVVAAERFELPDADELLTVHERVLFLERVNDHENLGAMFRSAVALGIDAVLLCPECSDPFYRRCVRVSMGHVLSVPFARVADWPSAFGLLGRHGHTTVALTPDASAVDLPAAGLDRLERVVLLAGAEGPGLRPEVIAAADRAVRIPMHGGADSLNVATAVAVAAYELGRDRSR